jgi:hypothetical protein
MKIYIPFGSKFPFVGRRRLEIASDAETQTGTATDRLVTPANLSARTATISRTGIAELATEAETKAQADMNRVVTPAGLRGTLDYPGRYFHGVLRLAANVADAETVTIASQVYEFKAAGDAQEGNIKVDVSGGLTPALAGAALVAAINAQSVGYKAKQIDNNTILVSATLAADGLNYDTTETMAGAGNAWDAATLTGGDIPARLRVFHVERVPLAAEVAADTILIPLPFDPIYVNVEVRVTAGGAVKAWDGGFTVTNGAAGFPAYLTLSNGGSVDWAVTDTIYILALG